MTDLPCKSEVNTNIVQKACGREEELLRDDGEAYFQQQAQRKGNRQGVGQSRSILRILNGIQPLFKNTSDVSTESVITQFKAIRYTKQFHLLEMSLFLPIIKLINIVNV